MAFPIAAGHGNLPNGNAFPVIYSKKVLKKFRKASIAEDITNSDYQGEILNVGDSVRIIKEPSLTVKPYARGAQLVSDNLIDEDLVMVVDQANYFQFDIDDIEKKQTHIDWIDLATNEAAYRLKDAFDTHVLSYMQTQVSAAMIYGTSGSPIDVGFGAGEVSPLAVMNRLSRLLDENNVPTENRWLVADPVFWEQVGDENSKLLNWDNAGTSGQDILRNGRVTNGPIRGFQCYKSNNLPLIASATTTRLVMAGHMSSTATASQIAQTEMFRSPTSFADVCRGLHVFGRKTLRPEAIAYSAISVD